MSKFIVKQGSPSAVGVEIPVDRVQMVFGRTEECDVVVLDPNVSRRHAQSLVLDGLVAMMDLGSSNGTYVNGLPISRIFLMDGDEVRFGETVMVFAEGDGGTDAAAMPEGRRSTRADRAAGEHGAPAGAASAVATAGDGPGAAETLESAPQAPDVLDRTLMFASLADDGQIDALKGVYLKLKALYRVFHEVTQATNLKEMCEAVGRAATVSTAVERVSFFLNADKSGGGWQRYFSHAAARLDDRSAKLPESTRVLDELKADMKPATGITDASGRTTPHDGPDADTVAVPLVRSGRLVGALYADSPAGRKPLAKNDIDFLTTMALQVAARLGQFDQVAQLKQENTQLRRKLDEDFAVVVQNERMRRIMAVTERVADSNATVLVTGESGTGKELIAKSIHRFSRRGTKPLVAVNCAALPDTLLESELFGHEKGSFTGAIDKRVGKFEQADGGTLFLDEIGDISPAAQAKLLRALQEGEITRVGGAKTIKVDVRLIAATNKDLMEEVREGRFREDLYYRLKVIEIQLPPLRDRPDDIPVLAEHFLKQLRGKTPTSVKTIAPETMRVLGRYPFPGNIRELRNVIERGLVFAFGEELLPEHLPMELLADPGASMPPAAGGAARTAQYDGPRADAWNAPGDGDDTGTIRRREMESGGGTPLSLAELEKRHIQHVLKFTKGNKLKAATLLGISRTTLYEKLKLYDLAAGASAQ